MGKANGLTVKLVFNAKDRFHLSVSITFNPLPVSKDLHTMCFPSLAVANLSRLFGQK